MGLEITVSPLVKSDIPAILEIENDSQPEPWSETAFLEEIGKAHSRVLVVRQAPAASVGPDSLRGVIAGYICFWSVVGEIQVLNIAVRRDLRRKGIGRRLIDAAIRAGREDGARWVTLEVRQSNLEARKLYESIGFRIVGERPNYYGEMEESAILMTLDIVECQGCQTDDG